MKKVNILWTGGWDSTYRIMTLIDKNVIIQPYYLKFGRKSEQTEISVIGQITSMVESKRSTKCVINSLIVVEGLSLGDESSFHNSLKNLRTENFLGAQYVKLGMLSKCNLP